jgi:exopolysaccharide biosynthesis polyprenyl glycosylphosphotransferase
LYGYLQGIASSSYSAYSEVQVRGRHVGLGSGEKLGELGDWVEIHSTFKQAGDAGEAVINAGMARSSDLAIRRAGRTKQDNAAVRGARLRRRALMLADVVALIGACAVASFGTALVEEAPTVEALGAAAFLMAVLLPLWIGTTAISGLYRRDERRADLTATDDVVPVTVVLSIAVWSMVVAATLTGADVPASILVLLWAAAIVLVLTARTVARSIAGRRPEYVQNTLIVGAGDVGQLLGRKLSHHPELGLRLVGFVDDDPKKMRRDLEGTPVVGTSGELRDLVTKYDVQRIVVAFSNESHSRQLELVHTLRNLNVQIDVVPRLFEAIGPAVSVHYVEGLPLVALPPVRVTSLSRAVKRVIDVAGSAFALLLLSPLFLYIAWSVKRGSDGPVFFRQERLGENMKPFELLKFRTMQVDTDEAPHREYVRSIMDVSEAPNENNLYKLQRPDAVTRVGAWLRRTSLDELPQLLNVLRGDMSLVGPRPCMAYESDFFEPHHFDRFLVPAGMTGLWQVTARARSTFKEALDLDAAYARDWTIALDLKLMMQTPLAVLRSKGTT